MGSLDQRYYATGAGRFMTADPYSGLDRIEEPRNLNLYSYVNGDPVNNKDSSGFGDEKNFCDVYPSHPLCGPSPRPQTPLPSPSPPPDLETAPVWADGLQTLPGAVAGILRLTDECAKGLGGTDGRSAAAKFYALLAKGAYQDLGFNSSVTEAATPGGGYTYSLAWNFAQAQFEGNQIVWNTNPRIADVSNVFIGVGSISGTTYSINLLQEFSRTFDLDPAQLSIYQYQAIYLLHELGHAYGTTLTTIDTDPAVNRKNTQTVIDSCFKDLKKK